MPYMREDVKGYLLKQVVVRIEYKDIFGLSKDTKTNIGIKCNEFGLSKQGYRMLDETDIETNDIVSSNSIPYEYLKEIHSFVFFNEERTFIVEINQLFIKITQYANKNDRLYDQTIKFLEPILEYLFSFENQIDVKRISVKKSNEVFFKEIASFRKYFEPDILRFNQFKMAIDWESSTSQSTLIQNFSIGDIFVNFQRIFDNGTIDGEKAFRLYLDYETYLKNVGNTTSKNIISELLRSNTLLYNLFTNSLTTKALDLLSKNERIGDFCL